MDGWIIHALSLVHSDLIFQVILPDGKLEKAVDDEGVLRDVLSEFSNDFYKMGAIPTS